MKYKVIAEILDGTICASNSRITCFISNTMHDKEGHKIDPQIGEILPKITTDDAEYYWSYSRKEWDKMNEAFQKLK